MFTAVRLLHDVLGIDARVGHPRRLRELLEGHAIGVESWLGDEGDLRVCDLLVAALPATQQLDAHAGDAGRVDLHREVLYPVTSSATC